MRRARAFTLVEILLVVVLLAVLAVIVIPAFADSTKTAKQSALAQDLKVLQRFVLVYKGLHLEVSPGYPGGNTSMTPTQAAFVAQATMATNTQGVTQPVGTAGYDRGPYVAKIPANPVNGLNTIEMLGDGESFPDAADDSHGWIYKAATGEIRADSAGVDTFGVPYYSY